MVTIIKSGTSKKTIDEKLEKLYQQEEAGFDAKKFCGSLKLNDDALLIQKRLRYEWKLPE